ncbi:endonuclease/exonuclease/phosphatase family protein [Candidatus Latescibacterota bacterium]
MKRLFTLILICAAMSMAVMSVSCRYHTGHSRTIRIMTFNLHHCEGIDKVYDVARIAGLIREQKTDIILCQEVDRGYSDRSKNDDQPSMLAEMLGYHSYYGPNIGDTYGNLILSRFPLESARNVPLPNPDDKEPRGVIVSMVSINGRRLHLLDTHLSAFSKENRDIQVRFLQEMIKKLGNPVIFGADFNCRPSGQLAPLLGAEYLTSSREKIGIDEAIDDILISPGLTKHLSNGVVIPTTYSDHPAYWIDIRL